MKTKKNISFIGMPAVGKSTVGNLLTQKIDFAFLDSDDLIQSREHQTLAQIISSKGRSRFLEIEEQHILSIDCSHHVIATGGSVIYSPKAMAHLSRISTILYLFVDLKTLLTRLSDITARGVAIDEGKSIEDLYKERTPLYDKYHDIKIDCTSMTAEQVAERVMAYLS
ncbi:shikimate kinase [Desulfobacula sp.]|uniref:shikimate kinase n=1 Tax=Desulfobacula sp. TaxID=2593537 RepID=UPI002606E660|nr:shikimate kinase [Desulfobacula sp.]